MQKELEVTACLRALNEGRFDVRAEGPGGEMASLVNQIANRLQALSAEMDHLRLDLADEGRFGGQIEIPDPQGEWKTLASNVNAISANLTIQFRACARVITAIANGDLDLKLTLGAHGEIKELEDTINIMGNQLSKLASEISQIIGAVGANQPCDRIKVPGLAGTWHGLAANVDTLAADKGLLSTV